MYVLPVLAALVGAVLLALGSERQAAGVRAAEARTRPSVGADAAPPRRRGAGLLALLRSPAWLAGGALMLAGIVLNVTALAHAPLSVVQPIGAVAVAVTTVLHARTAGLRIDPRTWAAVGACMAGSAAFVLITLTATRPEAEPTRGEEGVTVTVAWTAVAACALLALWLRRRPHALPPILAAGVLYGFVAVCVRLTAVRVLDGLAPRWDVLAVLVVAALLGVWFVQVAYRHGPPDLVVAGLTVIDPMVGVLVGVVVLGELRPGLPWTVGAGLVAAALVATVGIACLSRSHPDVVARREARCAVETPGESPS